MARHCSALSRKLVENDGIMKNQNPRLAASKPPSRVPSNELRRRMNVAAGASCLVARDPTQRPSGYEALQARFIGCYGRRGARPAKLRRTSAVGLGVYPRHRAARLPLAREERSY